MKHIGIVMAAGKGTRMGAETPKQFLEAGGKPILYYSLKAMQDSFIDEIILVTGEDYIEYCHREIVEKFSFSKVKRIVAGGAERSDSVYAGLSAVENPKQAYVYIQDGARPMLSADILKRAREDAEAFGSSVIAVPSKDTVKIVDDNGFVISTPDRKTVWNVQTPQTFKCDELLAAYNEFRRAGDITVTDDSQVYELFASLPAHVTMGDYCNIKITTPEDLITVENFLQKK